MPKRWYRQLSALMTLNPADLAGTAHHRAVRVRGSLVEGRNASNSFSSRSSTASPA
jgi:hypothetical protein